MYETVFEPERKNWCVPAALQTILNRREIPFSQEEISQNLEENKNGGFGIGIKELSGFLRRFELDTRFYNPFKEITEPDLFFKDELISNQDILLFYDLSLINNKLPPLAGHVSHVLNYDGNETIEITDGFGHKKVSTRKIYAAVHPDLSKDYGFYVIK